MHPPVPNKYAGFFTNYRVIVLFSQQPWSTYALHIATFTSLAFVVDPLLLASLWWGTEGWNLETRQRWLWAQFIYMFAFTKVVKLVGLFRRNPSDIIFLPLSIMFGYFHGLIKLYALLTLNMVGNVQNTGFQTSPADFNHRPHGAADLMVMLTMQYVWLVALEAATAWRHLDPDQTILIVSLITEREAREARATPVSSQRKMRFSRVGTRCRQSLWSPDCRNGSRGFDLLWSYYPAILYG